MKKILMLLVAVAISAMFGGCMASKVYDGAKPIYKVGKKIVKASPITDKTKSRLRKLDGEIMDYDKVRNVVKPIIKKRVILK